MTSPGSSEPYPCYCLPGPARCDDDTACDRYVVPLRPLLDLATELEELSHDEKSAAMRYAAAGAVGSIPALNHEVRADSFWHAAYRLNAVITVLRQERAS